ncbi:hypothetical protein [Paenibacillus spongiae]|uniref:Uncharacterized protein n=1 Tax=Paenibacillus spongiae TaxID=2909671 RepID=A0ABY5SBY4_9BACL|nr:hypothetical protein [Paenibacillus spongiae]UVI31442.1 hypothetical protein L1F29_06360 [Paenibacillus spongiae]
MDSHSVRAYFRVGETNRCHHSHGETHLSHDLHKVLVHQSRIVKAAESNYYGVYPTASIGEDDGHVMMLDNENIRWVHSDGTENQGAQP